MKFLALLSGGKDSIYAALESLKYGHELVCIDLEEEEKIAEECKEQSTDLDSYMFQTVGVEIVPLIAECMQKPLIRKPITGGSVNQELFYDKAKEGDEDEVEDLYELIKEAKETYQIDAVASGAILSDYQRLRVENICDRLGLVSLSYLWQRDQAELLDDMIDNELDARFVKIACIGLKPSFLMKSIQEMRDELHQLKDMYQINVCGEGGEYESIVLDCPLFIDHKIVVNEFKILNISEDEYAPVAHVIIKQFALAEKEEKGGNIELYDIEKGQECHCAWPQMPKEEIISIATEEVDCDPIKILSSEINNSFSTSLLSLDSFDVEICPEQIEDEINLLMEKSEELLNENGLGFKNVTKVVMYIKKMYHFPHINKVYKKYFQFKPPTRVCVAKYIDPAFNIVIGFQGVCDPSNIKTLHVQSVSRWAPANIGPYSQACETELLTHYAGQIGLKPAIMAFTDSSSIKQLQQCFVNYEKVLTRMQNTFEDVIQCIVYLKYDGAHKDKIKEKVNEKFPNCPIVYMCAKELPRNAEVELSLVTMNKDHERNFSVEDQTTEIQGISTNIHHQHLEVKDKCEIDVYSFDLPSPDFCSILSSLIPSPCTSASGLTTLTVYYQKDLCDSPRDFKCMVHALLEERGDRALVNCVPVECLCGNDVVVFKRNLL
ncbi:unnamed protein product [Moneuplotes crassus]|uniref:Diphthine--ammonia ligase n=1 Tax=Euplotes crassus TaxID=5936 RepID=A0AAD1X2U0_EUPCR|nr:unnamed protein product [Moneuplotes crassus]